MIRRTLNKIYASAIISGLMVTAPTGNESIIFEKDNSYTLYNFISNAEIGETREEAAKWLRDNGYRC